MFRIEVIRVFNRSTDKTSYYKVVEGRKIKISKVSYYNMEISSYDSDCFHTESDSNFTRNYKTLKFLYNPFKEVN